MPRFRVAVEMTDFEKLAAQLRAAASDVKKAGRRIELEVARAIFAEAKRGMRESMPAGRLYVRSRPLRRVRASAPGQPPAIDMESFIRSIYIRRASSGYFVGSADRRASWFEDGTRRMLPRPWLTPAQVAVAPRIGKIAERVLEDAL